MKSAPSTEMVFNGRRAAWSLIRVSTSWAGPVNKRLNSWVVLADDFYVRDFHDHVLENDTVPLKMLRSHIENWLDSAQYSSADQ